MIRDTEFSKENISSFIKSDSVGRNTFLISFIGMLNNIEHSAYISIDAGWGAGKTVFMKQLEYLNYCELSNFNAPNINEETLKTFQDKYVVFYYNAWENDYYNDALQSLLFSLINRFYTDTERKKKLKNLTAQAVKSIANEAVKLLTKGIVDIDKITNIKTTNDLVNSIQTTNKRKEAVSKIISEILPENKKFIFIIDELDRCNPQFAIRLMEVAKHYCNDDNIVFLFSTNNRQLVHTIKKYYGNDFDGYGYLDKLYDLSFELPSIEVEKYFHTQLSIPNDSYYVNTIPIEIAICLKMTMREINRYHTKLSFIKSKLDGGNSFDSSGALMLTHFVFIPLALALKIKDIKLYDSFVSGHGEEIISNLCSNNDAISDIVSRIKGETGSIADVATTFYKKIITANNISHEKSDYYINLANESFKNLLPLISNIR